MNTTLSLRISVLGLHHTDAAQVLLDFVCTARQQYEVGIQDEADTLQQECETTIESIPSTNHILNQSSLIISVPFSAREQIRIAFNIYAADFELQHPEESSVYFKLESV